MSEAVELSVGVVTFFRPEVLNRCISRLAAQARDRPIEIVVCDSAGSDEATGAVLDRWLGEPGLTVRRAEAKVQRNVTAAWEACTRAARSENILFLCDDGLVGDGLLDRHISFHRDHLGRRFALQGRITESALAEPTPFMRWTEASGIRFGCPEHSSESVPGWLFRFMNGSVATRELLDRGFDLAFDFGGDDIDMGMRLCASGVTLSYDAGALVEHFHPTDLLTTMGKLRRYGNAGRGLRERYPDYPQPRAPALRHRAWAQLLTLLNLARIRPTAVREETWRFLCTQALREGLWEAAGEESEPRVGAVLAKRAARDPGASWPEIT